MQPNTKTSIIVSIIALALYSLVGYFVYPEPGIDYSGLWRAFWTGSVHGTCVLPNYVFSLFDESRMVIGESTSWWYKLCYWAAAVYSTFQVFIKPIIAMTKNK